MKKLVLIISLMVTANNATAGEDNVFCRIHAKPSLVKPGESFTIHWDTRAKKVGTSFGVASVSPKGEKKLTAKQSDRYFVRLDESYSDSCSTCVHVNSSFSPKGSMKVISIREGKEVGQLGPRRLVTLEAVIPSTNECPEDFYVESLCGGTTLVGPNMGGLITKKEANNCIIKFEFDAQTTNGSFELSLHLADHTKEDQIGKVIATTLVHIPPWTK
jgi:hypothetical protein